METREAFRVEACSGGGNDAACDRERALGAEGGRASGRGGLVRCCGGVVCAAGGFCLGETSDGSAGSAVMVVVVVVGGVRRFRGFIDRYSRWSGC